MKNDLELLGDKSELEGAIRAINRGREDGEGNIVLSKVGVIELLETGIDAIDELERFRKAAGPSYLKQVEVVVDGLKKEKP